MDIREYVSYNAETGEFYWIRDTNPRGPSKVGRLAGYIDPIHGYWRIRFMRENLHGHRIAWYLTHGYWPDHIDHINEVRHDNRLCNLRECTHGQNLHAANRDIKLGYEVHGAKYRARIWVNDIRIELGSFDTPEEARAAYLAARHNYLEEFA